ncbi:hypothetical protein ACHHYP_12558 [Achlya hypogyna]|uniref:Uncharacterized protein n=1 Tax=Achlya hypogyna TaxID=1202772 RepID=A0A1V9YGQ5_ACHHY|nr:hypothetical protein ACHHYP_12558 [Achlya hypogyna]
MYALRVQSSDGGSSQGSVESLVLDDAEPPRKPPSGVAQHPLGGATRPRADCPPANSLRAASPSSWVNKIGSTMFNKIKVAPTDQPRTERPPQYALPFPQDELRIAIAPARHEDREDPKPVLAKAGTLGQSIDFIKVYCSPKRAQASPKIKPSPATAQRPRPHATATSTPADKDTDSDADDDDYADESEDGVECMQQRSPSLRRAPTKEVLPTQVVPVLQSFFARPKQNARAKSSSIQSIDKRIHRQEQYKRDLNRHDELRAAHAARASAERDVDAQLARIEAWKQQMRSLKRQRMLEISQAKLMLAERQARQAALLDTTRAEWEASFEDDVALLSAAFAKAQASDRPMTTAGSVALQAERIVERDKVLGGLRAQTAPTHGTPPARSRRLEPTEETIDSRPSTGESDDHTWLETSQVVPLDGGSMENVGD